jgi:hypothetical protein
VRGYGWTSQVEYCCMPTSPVGSTFSAQVAVKTLRVLLDWHIAHGNRGLCGASCVPGAGCARHWKLLNSIHRVPSRVGPSFFLGWVVAHYCRTPSKPSELWSESTG